MRRLSLFAKDRSGAAGAELALVLPMLLALILVTLEGAHYLYCEHKVAKGVRDGARYGARLAFSNYNCAQGTIEPAAVEQIRQVTRSGFPNGDNPTFGGADNPVFAGWATGDVTVSLSCATGQGGLYTAVGGTAPRVRVNANVTYPFLFNLAGLNVSSMRLRAAAESAVMGL